MKDQDLRVYPITESSQELTAIFPRGIVKVNAKRVSHENSRTFLSWPLCSTTLRWFPMPACIAISESIKLTTVLACSFKNEQSYTRRKRPNKAPAWTDVYSLVAYPGTAGPQQGNSSMGCDSVSSIYAEQQEDCRDCRQNVADGCVDRP